MLCRKIEHNTRKLFHRELIIILPIKVKLQNESYGEFFQCCLDCWGVLLLQQETQTSSVVVAKTQRPDEKQSHANSHWAMDGTVGSARLLEDGGQCVGFDQKRRESEEVRERERERRERRPTKGVTHEDTTLSCRTHTDTLKPPHPMHLSALKQQDRTLNHNQQQGNKPHRCGGRERIPPFSVNKPKLCHFCIIWAVCLFPYLHLYIFFAGVSFTEW